MDESELCLYFGEANLGTGYLFIYQDKDYSSDDLLKGMMPDNWKPPTVDIIRPETTTRDVEAKDPPLIVASSRVSEEEYESLPTEKNNSPSMLPARPKTPGLNIETKRGSLPSVHVGPTAMLSPVPQTATSIMPMDMERDGKDNGWGWFSSKEKKKK